MRRFAILAAMVTCTSVSALAQEISVLGSSAVRGSELVRHGFGLALAGSFRLGDILVDTTWARRANVRLGLRVSVTEARFNSRLSFLCVDDCPANAFDASVVARTTKATLNVLPVVTSATRVDVNAGIASYRRDQRAMLSGNSWRASDWGFVAGGTVSRRFSTSPFWLHLAYTRHGDVQPLADSGSPNVPKHSVAAGLTFRTADRTKR